MTKNVRVSICAFDEGRVGHVRSLEQPNPERIHQAMDMVRVASLENADLVVFPEISCLLGCVSPVAHAEEINGPVWTTVAKTAKKYGVFVAFNHPLIEEGKTYNATVLFNRDGNVEGYYAKSFPTNGELSTPKNDCHVSPGTGAVVLDTSIGRIGFAICFDLNFPSLRSAYVNERPDIMLFSSMYAGGQQCEAWAMETQSYFVGCIVGPGSRVLNRLGRLRNEMRSLAKQVTHTLNVDSRVYHWDYNHRRLDDLKLKYGKEIEIEYSDDEGVFMVTSIGDVTMQEIEEKVGLEPLNAYFARSTRNVEKASVGEFPPAEKTGAW